MASKQFTLTNTGTGRVEIQSVTFNVPPGIGHTANLLNLGGSSTVTGNASGLTYSLAVGDTQTFDVDFSSTGAGSGTYNGTIVIGGSSGSSATITSTVVVAGSSPPPSADPLGWVGATSFNLENYKPGESSVSVALYFGNDGSIDGSGASVGGGAGVNGSNCDGTTVITSPTRYVSTLTSGIGNNYEIKVQISNPGSQCRFEIAQIIVGASTTSAYYPINTGEYLTFRLTSTGVSRTCTGTVYIRNKTTLNEISAPFRFYLDTV